MLLFGSSLVVCACAGDSALRGTRNDSWSSDGSTPSINTTNMTFEEKRSEPGNGTNDSKRSWDGAVIALGASTAATLSGARIGKLWPGVIPWSTADSDLRPDIQRSLGKLERSSNLRFVERVGQAAYIHFTKHANICEGLAPIGYGGGKSVVQISDPQKPGTFCWNYERDANVMHEVLHAVGLTHEHTREDRGHHVNYQANNVKAGQEQNFDQRPYDVRLDSHPYDIDSIMHYNSKAFSKDGTSYTLMRKNRLEYWSGKCTACPADWYKPSECSFVRERPCGFLGCEALCSTDEIKSNKDITSTDTLKINSLYPSAQPYFSDRDGYCTPWGTGGGDLCREQPLLDACKNVDSLFYLKDCVGDRECVSRLCRAEPTCVGFTERQNNKAYKLKSKATGVYDDRTGRYKCYTHREIREIEINHPSGGRGWCTPWGDDGGDLCKEQPGLAACDQADGKFYLQNCVGNKDCVSKLCRKEPSCKGFTQRVTDGAFKLKSQITAVTQHGSYRCFSFIPMLR